MSMHRNPNRKVVNFSAGPSALPHEVLEIAQKELINYEGTHTSVMEISHRSSTFSKIIHKAETSVKELLKVPDNYKILFLQGGGNGQFCSVAMNLINRRPKRSADYFVTGYWSERALVEAQKYGTANLAHPKIDKYNRIPPSSEWTLDPEASYIYICENETIDGVEYNESILDELVSRAGGVPIVADCCSNLFSRKINVSKYGLIFAGAQKNFGPAGVTVVIVREDLLGHQIKECPTIFDYKIQAGNNSLYQTPPCYGIYICGLVFDWLKSHGGMEGIESVNQKKSSLLYQVMNESNGFFRSTVDSQVRSRVTVPFRIYTADKPNEKLEKEFIEEAEKNHCLRELKGHRSVGGIRAAIFNAISYEEVEALANFMRDFHAKHVNSS